MAYSLSERLELLRGAPVDGLVAGAPAWTHYEHGPWPEPHDPIFDFATIPPAFTLTSSPDKPSTYSSEPVHPTW